VNELSFAPESPAKQARDLRIAASATSSDLAIALFGLLDARAAANQTCESSRLQRVALKPNPIRGIPRHQRHADCW
jgi:hypothetical protein